MKFTNVQKNRLIEILFYSYFAKKDSEIMKNPSFWQTIKFLCETYEINSLSVQRAVTILAQPDNMPNELESYYLLSKLGVTVRPMNAITGIYWQKQKELQASIDLHGPPVIKNRITDPVMIASIHAFIYATKDFFGCFRFMDYSLVDEFFK